MFHKSFTMAIALVLSFQVQALSAHAQDRCERDCRPEAGRRDDRRDDRRDHHDGPGAAGVVAGVAAGIGLIADLAAIAQANKEQQDAQDALDKATRNMDECSGTYVGKFKSGDAVTIDLGGGAAGITLTDVKTGGVYPATGSCEESNDGTSANIKFTLAGPGQFVFTGKIIRDNYKMTLAEIHNGKTTDHLLLIKKMED